MPRMMLLLGERATKCPLLLSPLLAWTQRDRRRPPVEVAPFWKTKKGAFLLLSRPLVASVFFFSRK
jgi:hypothetical protein